MISKQKERVKHAQLEHDEAMMDASELEATVEVAIERLIMSLAGRLPLIYPLQLPPDHIHPLRYN